MPSRAFDLAVLSLLAATAAACGSAPDDATAPTRRVEHAADPTHRIDHAGDPARGRPLTPRLSPSADEDTCSHAGTTGCPCPRANETLACASGGSRTCIGSEFPAWGPCVCEPTTCEKAAVQCGLITDGCGGALDCGSCALHQTCGGDGAENQCGCAPTTCAAAGAGCGGVPDGCGGTLDCGSCSPYQSCGGSGVANQCGCSPIACASVGAVCGTIADGCGGWADCGACPTGTCVSNLCESYVDTGD